MKKVLYSLFALALVSFLALSPANAITVPAGELPVLNAKTIMLPIGKTGQTISLLDLAHISVKDFETVSGRKMKIWDKVGFKLGQRQLRSKIEADGTIKKDVARKLSKGMADGESGFHIGGFALGFLLGLIGILIAYLINDDKKSNRVKWAWLGLAAYVVILLVVLLA